MQMTRISIPVSIEEREALRAHARAALRNPRDHARHLLRVALGLVEEPTQEYRSQKNDEYNHTPGAAVQPGEAAEREIGMCDQFLLDILKYFTCPNCGHVGLRHYAHHEDGRVQYWLACTHCVWEQGGLYDELGAAINKLLADQKITPPAIAPTLPTAEAAIAETYRRMAAAAEQQAADIHIIREMLETLHWREHKDAKA